MIRLFVFLTAVLISKITFSRELTNKEKLAVYNKEQAFNVMKSFSSQIIVADMTFPQRVQFETLKRACLPMKLLLGKIEREPEPEDEPKRDHAQELSFLYRACGDGSLRIADLYLKQNPDF